jgi:hypothetical protein
MAYGVGAISVGKQLFVGIDVSKVRQRLVKTVGRLVKHAHYYRLLLSESYLARRLFGGILRRVATLPRWRDRRLAQRCKFR